MTCKSTKELVELARSLQGGKGVPASDVLFTDVYDIILEMPKAGKRFIAHYVDKDDSTDGMPQSTRELMEYVAALGPGALANGEVPKVR
jgi:hypothetical protein